MADIGGQRKRGNRPIGGKACGASSPPTAVRARTHTHTPERSVTWRTWTASTRRSAPPSLNLDLREVACQPDYVASDFGLDRIAPRHWSARRVCKVLEWCNLGVVFQGRLLGAPRDFQAPRHAVTECRSRVEARRVNLRPGADNREKQTSRDGFSANFDRGWRDTRSDDN